MPTLLIIDDEPNVLYSLRAGLESDEVRVLTAKTARQGRSVLANERPDAVIVDVRLPDQSGLELFDQIHQADPLLPVIVVTAFATTETAIEAMKRGAFEYLLKPVDLHHLREVVNKAFSLRRMRTVPAAFADTPADGDADRIIGNSPAMQEVYKTIGRFAPQDVTVLILGESGTGKELIARALFQHSKRANRSFLAINCAAIPESLLESELFGHEKGAFTGADRQRVGKFEQADGGTLFLDEIGDMSPATQAKVLRALQDQQFERVGGRDTIRTDVRLIAATNQNLDELTAAGRFRQDLLYRLNGVTIRLPPLRDRKEDLPALVDHFLRQQGAKLGKAVHAIAPEAMTLLERHDWPGNIRELENILRYGVIQAVSGVLTADCLPGSLVGRGEPVPRAGTVLLADVRDMVRTLLKAGTPDLYRQMIQSVDRVLLAEVLEYVQGNQVHASELLGISRTTLRAKLASREDDGH
ncbi:MAG: sigma-54 dependent transcriptional regulator [Fimbriiglobus sp.]|nr:sigma-54 dependent transcriptional regulator [Fimbriiglobus sp.]